MFSLPTPTVTHQQLQLLNPVTLKRRSPPCAVVREMVITQHRDIKKAVTTEHRDIKQTVTTQHCDLNAEVVTVLVL